MKTALVTGSVRGVGKGIAAALIAEGYKVYINGRNQERVNSAVKELGKHALPLVADMCNEEDIKKAIAQISEHDFPDLIVANVGSGKSIPGWNVSLEEFRRVFDLNFFGAVTLCTEAVKIMAEKGGSIVIISSIAGCESIKAPIAYTSAKSALLSYSKSLSDSVADMGIRVNAVSPGNVMFKEGTWDLKMKDNRESVEEYINSNVPLKGFAAPEDIGKAVVFLENSRFITGTNIVVDGGQLRALI